VKETQLIKDYKKAVIALKEFEENDKKYRKLLDNLFDLHCEVFWPDNLDIEGKLKRAREMREWLESIDFVYC
jgi:hypothetical protein